MSGGYSCLFGPVRSRRLGRSLGIDLVPLKVCSWDCPYCQVGATTNKTLERREYVPVEQVLAEFDDWLSRDGQADVVTLAGGGEPTLHARFGTVISEIGRRCAFRKILLSNGSLFWDAEVREQACFADVVKATLSAWDQGSYESLHQPHPLLRFDSFFEGLKAFRRQFKGEFWIEVFVVPGVNDDPAPLRRVAERVAALAPSHVHLNTAVRPARDGLTRPVTAERLGELAGLFTPVAEVIASVLPVGAPAPGEASSLSGVALEQKVVALLRRHPCPAADIAASVGLAPLKVGEFLENLVERGVLAREITQGITCYRVP